MAETKKTNKATESVKSVASSDGRKNMNIKARRFLASLINICTIVIDIVNIIFWFMDKEPVGQSLFATEGFQDSSKGQRFVFGLFAILMYATLIGFVINIYFWATDQESVAVKLTKLVFEK